jgi:hypothetical protein
MVRSRGAACASGSSISQSTTLEIIWVTVEMIVGPPGEPVTRRTPPSGPRRMAGVMAESIRFPGSTAFASPCTRPYWLGVPGLAAKSSISLFRRNPAPSTVTRLP